MGQYRDIDKIKRLAHQLGTPLINHYHSGNKIKFIYGVNGSTVEHSYNNSSRGIDEEIERLERLLRIQI